MVIVYQPVRHVLYNNTQEKVRTLQEHYGREIQPAGEADINGLFDTPLMNRIVVGNKELDPKLRFASNGEIHLFSFSTEQRSSFRLPESWAQDRFFWKEYRYQLNSDGKIYLANPNDALPMKTFTDQPIGFPIQLSDK